MGTKEDKLTETVARVSAVIFGRPMLARLAMIAGVGLFVWGVDDVWKWIVGAMLIVGGFVFLRRKS
jgi:hypothetical protein